jgi:glycerophosphoryl diester phosphodiesterase
MAAMMKPSTSAIVARSWKETLVVGHRGAAAYKPENTLPAFEEAIASGVEATECDVHTSREGEVVVMHDATLDRTTSLKGAVKDTAWSDMKAAGVPSLADLTRLTKDRIVLVVEIKAGEDVERKVVDHLNAEGLRDQSIVFSFGAHHVAKVEALDKDYFSVWLVGKKLTPADYEGVLSEAARIGADGIGLQYRNVTPEIVRLAHQRKVPVFVWTVPPGPEVDLLKEMRVNFIITDHPRDVRRQLKG